MSSDDPDALAATVQPHIQALLDSIGAFVYVKDLQGRYLFANAEVCALYGRAPEHVRGALDADFVDLEHSPRLVANDNAVLSTGKPLHDEEELVLHSGRRHRFWTTKVPLRDAQGEVVAVCGFSTEIAWGGTRPEQLISDSPLLGMLLAHIDACIYLKDAQGRYLYANPRVLQLYGCTSDQVLGRDDTQIHPPEVAGPLMALDREVLASLSRHASEEVIRDADGLERHYWSIKLALSQPGLAPCLIGFSTDITELLQLRQNLERARVTDTLTDLPNYVQLQEELAIKLHLAARSHERVAVILLDMDEFKFINAHLGQQAGDRLLREAAQRLRHALAPQCSLARVGGDAYAVLLPGVPDAQAAQAQTERLRGALAEPFSLLGHTVRTTASAGFALYPDDGEDADALLAHAEAAMYLAKERGRNQAQRYSVELSTAAAQRVMLESDLRAALQAGQFELHYQPKMQRDGVGIAGFEALLRWNRPGHGMVPPLQFIPLAEQLGLLTDVGAWVIDEACRTIAHWQALGLGGVSVAANLSPSQLRSAHLVESIRASLRRHGVAPGLLELEVTESMMMQEPDEAVILLRALSDLGLQLSIDDFGTGFSSMAWLKLLPVHTLKVDRIFVMNVDHDRRDAALCSGVIALAHALGLKVVAEGVETAAQHQALVAQGCDVFQGYWFSRPLPLAQATEFLRRAP